VLNYWNKLDIVKHKVPYPQEHPSKIAIRAAKFLNKIKDPFETIKQAMDMYKEIVTHRSNDLNCRRVGFKVGLDSFFVLNDYQKLKLKSAFPDKQIKSWYEECKKGKEILIRWTIPHEQLDIMEKNMEQLELLAIAYCKLMQNERKPTELNNKDWLNLATLLIKIEKFHSKNFDTSNILHNTTYTQQHLRKYFFDALLKRYKNGVFPTGQLLSGNSWMLFKDYLTNMTGRKYAD
jgi:hypothetical protein